MLRLWYLGLTLVLFTVLTALLSVVVPLLTSAPEPVVGEGGVAAEAIDEGGNSGGATADGAQSEIDTKLRHDSIGADLSSSGALLARAELVARDPYDLRPAESYQTRYGPWAESRMDSTTPNAFFAGLPKQQLASYRATRSMQASTFSQNDITTDYGARPSSLLTNQAPVAPLPGTPFAVDTWSAGYASRATADNKRTPLAQIAPPPPYALSDTLVKQNSTKSLPLCAATVANLSKYDVHQWVGGGPTNLDPGSTSVNAQSGMYAELSSENPLFCVVDTGSKLSCSAMNDTTKSLVRPTYPVLPLFGLERRKALYPTLSADATLKSEYGKRAYREGQTIGNPRVMKDQSWNSVLWQLAVGVSRLYWEKPARVYGADRKIDLDEHVKPVEPLVRGGGLVSTGSDNPLLPFWGGKDQRTWSYLGLADGVVDTRPETRADTWFKHLYDPSKSDVPAFPYTHKPFMSRGAYNPIVDTVKSGKAYFVRAKTIPDCSRLCARRECDADSDCHAFVHEPTTNECWIYSTTTEPAADEINLKWTDVGPGHLLAIKTKDPLGRPPLFALEERDAAAAEWELRRLATQLLRMQQKGSGNKLTPSAIDAHRRRLAQGPSVEQLQSRVCPDGAHVVGNMYYNSDVAHCGRMSCSVNDNVRADACVLLGIAYENRVAVTGNGCAEACENDAKCTRWYLGRYPEFVNEHFTTVGVDGSSQVQCPITHPYPLSFDDGTGSRGCCQVKQPSGGNLGKPAGTCGDGAKQRACSIKGDVQCTSPILELPQQFFVAEKAGQCPAGSHSLHTAAVCKQAANAIFGDSRYDITRGQIDIHTRCNLADDGATVPECGCYLSSTGVTNRKLEFKRSGNNPVCKSLRMPKTVCPTGYCFSVSSRGSTSQLLEPTNKQPRGFTLAKAHKRGALIASIGLSTKLSSDGKFSQDSVDKCSRACSRHNADGTRPPRHAMPTIVELAADELVSSPYPGESYARKHAEKEHSCYVVPETYTPISGRSRTYVSGSFPLHIHIYNVKEITGVFVGLYSIHEATSRRFNFAKYWTDNKLNEGVVTFENCMIDGQRVFYDMKANHQRFQPVKEHIDLVFAKVNKGAKGFLRIEFESTASDGEDSGDEYAVPRVCLENRCDYLIDEAGNVDEASYKQKTLADKGGCYFGPFFGGRKTWIGQTATVMLRNAGNSKCVVFDKTNKTFSLAPCNRNDTRQAFRLTLTSTDRGRSNSKDGETDIDKEAVYATLIPSTLAGLPYRLAKTDDHVGLEQDTGQTDGLVVVQSIALKLAGEQMFRPMAEKIDLSGKARQLYNPHVFGLRTKNSTDECLTVANGTLTFADFANPSNLQATLNVRSQSARAFEFLVLSVDNKDIEPHVFGQSFNINSSALCSAKAKALRKELRVGNLHAVHESTNWLDKMTTSVKYEYNAVALTRTNKSSRGFSNSNLACVMRRRSGRTQTTVPGYAAGTYQNYNSKGELGVIETGMSPQDCIKVAQKRKWTNAGHRNDKHDLDNFKNTCFYTRGDAGAVDTFVRQGGDPLDLTHTTTYFSESTGPAQVEVQRCPDSHPYVASFAACQKAPNVQEHALEKGVLEMTTMAKPVPRALYIRSSATDSIVLSCAMTISEQERNVMFYDDDTQQYTSSTLTVRPNRKALVYIRVERKADTESCERIRVFSATDNDAIANVQLHIGLAYAPAPGDVVPCDMCASSKAVMYCPSSRPYASPDGQICMNNMMNASAGTETYTKVSGEFPKEIVIEHVQKLKKLSFGQVDGTDAFKIKEYRHVQKFFKNNTIRIQGIDPARGIGKEGWDLWFHLIGGNPQGNVKLVIEYVPMPEAPCAGLQHGQRCYSRPVVRRPVDYCSDIASDMAFAAGAAGETVGGVLALPLAAMHTSTVHERRVEIQDGLFCVDEPHSVHNVYGIAWGSMQSTTGPGIASGTYENYNQAGELGAMETGMSAEDCIRVAKKHKWTNAGHRTEKHSLEDYRNTCFRTTPNQPGGIGAFIQQGGNPNDHAHTTTYFPDIRTCAICYKAPLNRLRTVDMCVQVTTNGVTVARLPSPLAMKEIRLFPGARVVSFTNTSAAVSVVSNVGTVRKVLFGIPGHSGVIGVNDYTDAFTAAFPVNASGNLVVNHGQNLHQLWLRFVGGNPGGSPTLTIVYTPVGVAYETPPPRFFAYVGSEQFQYRDESSSCICYDMRKEMFVTGVVFVPRMTTFLLSISAHSGQTCESDAYETVPEATSGKSGKASIPAGTNYMPAAFTTPKRFVQMNVPDDLIAEKTMCIVGVFTQTSAISGGDGAETIDVATTDVVVQPPSTLPGAIQVYTYPSRKQYIVDSNSVSPFKPETEASDENAPAVAVAAYLFEHTYFLGKAMRIGTGSFLLLGNNLGNRLYRSGHYDKKVFYPDSTMSNDSISSLHVEKGHSVYLFNDFPVDDNNKASYGLEHINPNSASMIVNGGSAGKSVPVLGVQDSVTHMIAMKNSEHGSVADLCVKVKCQDDDGNSTMRYLGCGRWKRGAYQFTKHGYAHENRVMAEETYRLWRDRDHRKGKLDPVIRAFDALAGMFDDGETEMKMDTIDEIDVPENMEVRIYLRNPPTPLHWEDDGQVRGAKTQGLWGDRDVGGMADATVCLGAGRHVALIRHWGGIDALWVRRLDTGNPATVTLTPQEKYNPIAFDRYSGHPFRERARGREYISYVLPLPMTLGTHRLWLHNDGTFYKKYTIKAVYVPVFSQGEQLNGVNGVVRDIKFFWKGRPDDDNHLITNINKPPMQRYMNDHRWPVFDKTDTKRRKILNKDHEGGRGQLYQMPGSATETHANSMTIHTSNLEPNKGFVSYYPPFPAEIVIPNVARVTSVQFGKAALGGPKDFGELMQKDCTVAFVKAFYNQDKYNIEVSANTIRPSENLASHGGNLWPQLRGQSGSDLSTPDNRLTIHYQPIEQSVYTCSSGLFPAEIRIPNVASVDKVTYGYIFGTLHHEDDVDYTDQFTQLFYNSSTKEIVVPGLDNNGYNLQGPLLGGRPGGDAKTKPVRLHIVYKSLNEYKHNELAKKALLEQKEFFDTLKKDNMTLDASTNHFEQDSAVDATQVSYHSTPQGPLRAMRLRNGTAVLNVHDLEDLVMEESDSAKLWAQHMFWRQKHQFGKIGSDRANFGSLKVKDAYEYRLFRKDESGRGVGTFTWSNGVQYYNYIERVTFDATGNSVWAVRNENGDYTVLVQYRKVGYADVVVKDITYLSFSRLKDDENRQSMWVIDKAGSVKAYVEDNHGRKLQKALVDSTPPRKHWLDKDKTFVSVEACGYFALAVDHLGNVYSLSFTQPHPHPIVLPYPVRYLRPVLHEGDLKFVITVDLHNQIRRYTVHDFVTQEPPKANSHPVLAANRPTLQSMFTRSTVRLFPSTADNSLEYIDKSLAQGESRITARRAHVSNKKVNCWIHAGEQGTWTKTDATKSSCAAMAKGSMWMQLFDGDTPEGDAVVTDDMPAQSRHTYLGRELKHIRNLPKHVTDEMVVDQSVKGGYLTYEMSLLEDGEHEDDISEFTSEQWTDQRMYVLQGSNTSVSSCEHKCIAKSTCTGYVHINKGKDQMYCVLREDGINEASSSSNFDDGYKKALSSVPDRVLDDTLTYTSRDVASGPHRQCTGAALIRDAHNYSCNLLSHDISGDTDALLYRPPAFYSSVIRRPDDTPPQNEPPGNQTEGKLKKKGFANHDGTAHVPAQWIKDPKHGRFGTTIATTPSDMVDIHADMGIFRKPLHDSKGCPKGCVVGDGLLCVVQVEEAKGSVTTSVHPIDDDKSVADVTLVNAETKCAQMAQTQKHPTRTSNVRHRVIVAGSSGDCVCAPAKWNPSQPPTKMTYLTPKRADAPAVTEYSCRRPKIKRWWQRAENLKGGLAIDPVVGYVAPEDQMFWGRMLGWDNADDVGAAASELVFDSSMVSVLHAISQGKAPDTAMEEACCLKKESNSLSCAKTRTVLCGNSTKSNWHVRYWEHVKRAYDTYNAVGLPIEKGEDYNYSRDSSMWERLACDLKYKGNQPSKLLQTFKIMHAHTNRCVYVKTKHTGGDINNEALSGDCFRPPDDWSNEFALGRRWPGGSQAPKLLTTQIIVDPATGGDKHCLTAVRKQGGTVWGLGLGPRKLESIQHLVALPCNKLDMRQYFMVPEEMGVSGVPVLNSGHIRQMQRYGWLNTELSTWLEHNKRAEAHQTLLKKCWVMKHSSSPTDATPFKVFMSIGKSCTVDANNHDLQFTTVASGRVHSASAWDSVESKKYNDGLFL